MKGLRRVMPFLADHRVLARLIIVVMPLLLAACTSGGGGAGY